MGRRFFVLLGVLLLVAILSAVFVGELAIIHGDAIVAALLADFLRYSLALLLVLVIATSVVEDYEFRQFDRLLTMPLARWQYIAAQTLVVASLGALLVLPVIVLVAIFGEASLGVYWALALWLELLLLGLLALLAGLSLEKVPLAVFFTLAVYLLAKLSGLISLMLTEAVRLAEGSATSRVIEFVFGAILYIVPDTTTFAESDVFFENHDLLAVLGTQLTSVAVYALFLLGVCLVDFYRKEFNF